MNAESGERAAAYYTMRSQPSDFIVDEEPLYPATGEGKHTFLRVEKTGRTTEQVASALARQAGVSAREVGYAGRKDRHAITRQWFSLPEVDPEAATEWELEGARVLEAARHPHKLKTGQLKGNRFEIVLRAEGWEQRKGAEVGDPAQRRSDEGGTGYAAPAHPGPTNAVTDNAQRLGEAKQHAERIRERGLPNRFGEQRFGHGGENAERAREMLASGRPPRDRRAARFLLSAYQSEVFNAVLEDRGEAYDSVLLGDLARVEESGGLFGVDDLSREGARAAAFEISGTGPIFGKKMRAPTGEAGAREQAVLSRFGLPDLTTLVLPKGLRARGGRRAFRVQPRDLEIEALGEAPGMRIRCGLPPGSYVTVLLDALVGSVRNGRRPSFGT